jgi:hypothetical protein
MASLPLTTTLLGIGLSAAIIFLLRRDHLHPVYGLFWLIVAGAAAVMGIWPASVDYMARLAGIAYSPALLLLVAVIVLLIKSLHGDIVNTRIERQVRRLNQRLAIYELEQSGYLSASERARLSSPPDE